jgi:ADP-ribosyl-[dinitrogen reductase] hydrolase
MSIPILKAVANGQRLEDDSTLDVIVSAWQTWAVTAQDVGAQTRRVLSGLPEAIPGLAHKARELARLEHIQQGRSGGNGSLMRTAPVALAYLGPNDGPALAEAARNVSKLTHYDDEAADACVLWCAAIRNAILTGQTHISVGLRYIPLERRLLWEQRIAAAERPAMRTWYFQKNGWVVEALQAAWCAIHGAADRPTPAERLRMTLEYCARGGNDTDTVGAIAGGLIGGLIIEYFRARSSLLNRSPIACEGASAIPQNWAAKVHGWPGLLLKDIVALAHEASVQSLKRAA